MATTAPTQPVLASRVISAPDRYSPFTAATAAAALFLAQPVTLRINKAIIVVTMLGAARPRRAWPQPIVADVMRSVHLCAVAGEV